MYSLPGWFWSLPFPPLQDSPGFLPFRAFPSPLSFRPFCLLSVHKCLFSRPPPVSGPPHRPSPIVHPPESYQPSGSGRPMSSSGFPTQRPICRFAPPPPRPVRLVVLGLGVGGGAKETAPPAVVLSPSSRWQASPAGGQVHAYARRSIYLLSSCVSRLVLSPSSRQVGSTRAPERCLPATPRRSSSLLILAVPVSLLSVIRHKRR